MNKIMVKTNQNTPNGNNWKENIEKGKPIITIIYSTVIVRERPRSGPIKGRRYFAAFTSNGWAA